MVDESIVEFKRKTVLAPEQIEAIKNNPRGLTKEGCEEELSNWKKSSNKYMIRMYSEMLVHCKCFKASARTTAGSIILAKRKDGTLWLKKKITDEE